jgi:general stress protein 26
MMTNEDAVRQKLWDLIKRHRFAMMTTLEEGGALHSRPMTTIERGYDGSLWFFAKADADAVSAVAVHEQVCLSYADAPAKDFVCVAGPASIVTDVAIKRQLWNADVQAWLPEGAESPLNVLLKIVPEHAEYWDSTSNTLVRLFTKAKALATGRAPRDSGEHRIVSMPGETSPRKSAV